MSTIRFYKKLINTDSLALALKELDLSDEQRLHLLDVVESSLDHAILDAILSELSDKDKELFLTYITENDDKKIWKFLNEKIEKIEEKIVATAEALKKELHEDIKKTKGN